MSHAHSESDLFPTAIVVPDVLDTTYPTTVAGALGDLADRTRYIANTLDSQAETAVEYADVTAQFTGILVPDPTRFPLSGLNNAIGAPVRKLLGNLRKLRHYVWGAGESNQFLPITAPPVLEFSNVVGGGYQTPGSNVLGTRYWNAGNYNGSGSVAWYQRDVAAAAGLTWHISGLPPAGTIIFMGAFFMGAGAHAGLPATMPTLSLHSTVIGSTLTNEEATVTDGSANTTAYQAAHLVSAGMSVGITQNTLYSLRVTGETSTNALVNLQVSGLYVAISE